MSPRFFVAALFFALPLTLHAHGALQSSSPRSGAQLSVAPQEIRLTFNEVVTAGLSRLELVGPSGNVTLGPAGVPDNQPRVLVVATTGPWMAGLYTVRWQVAGPDGHPVRGVFTFTILSQAVPEAVMPAEAPAAVQPSPRPTPAPNPSRDAASVDGPAFVAIRWLTLAASLVALGVAVFGVVLAPTLAAAAGEQAWERIRQHGRWAAAVTVGLAFLRLNAQAQAFGGTWRDIALIRSLTVGTPWGVGLLLQLVGGGSLWWTLRETRKTAATQVGTVFAALAVALAPALSGHAAAEGVTAVVLDWVHVVGAGGWLGTLYVLLVAGMPATRSLRQEDQGSAVKDMVVRFSRVALVCAGLAAATGAIATWRNVGSLEALVASTYGRVLLIKLGVLSLVGATGAWNWRVVTPRLGTPGGTVQLRRTATLEVAVALLVVMVTAVLVATPPPAEATGMAAAERAHASR